MGACVKRPANPRRPWPPSDFDKAQPVKFPDDWASLQRTFKRDEVWDIIYYNFHTYDTDEVNWYLQEYVGCRETSPDGRNYRFGRQPGNSRPVVVYIPKWDWMPPGPHQKEARQAVITVLREPSVANLHFQAGTMELRRGDLTLVADAIEHGKIRLLHRPSLGHMAVYDPSRNRMAIPFDRLPPVGSRALIVHEAVHAVMDIRKVPQTMVEAESAAYIAQALYLKLHGLDMADSVVSPGFFANPRNFIAWRLIFDRAAAIADTVATTVSDGDLRALAAGLNISKTYENEGAPANDGI